MSTDIEICLREYYATTPPAVRPVGVLVVSHSALARRFVFWPEPYAGQIVSDEYGPLDVQYAPMMLDRAGSEGNLDQEFSITLDTKLVGPFANCNRRHANDVANLGC